jgi:Ca-activated chloride channel family protein
MTRFLACGALVFAALAALLQAGPQDPAGNPQGPTAFRSVAELVRVFVTVTDDDGRLVTTLTQEDFEVRDEGRPQPITLFDNTPRPIRLIVMLDVSGSMEGNLGLLHAAADQLFGRLGPEDVARVGTFGNDIEISSRFTNDSAELRAGLPRSISPNAPTPLWRALNQAMDSFEEREPADGEARPVILVLSDGKDSGPIGWRQPFVTQVDIIDRAREEDVMIYGIGMRSRSNRARMPPIGPGGLQAMMVAELPDPGLALTAEDTGGGYTEIRPNQDLGAAFAAVLDELHSQYLIGFAPPRRDGKTHDIDVRVKQRDMEPRARKSYVAPRG